MLVKLSEFQEKSNIKYRGKNTEAKYDYTAFLASTDRVAIDAVGLAILKLLESSDAIMNRKIFEREQIEKTVEIGLGACSPLEIDIVSVDPESQKYCDGVVEMLMKG